MGLWAVSSALATRTTEPGRASAITLAAATIVVGAYTLIWEPTGDFGLEELQFPALAGASLGVGMVAFYLGLSRGNTGIVTAISALYFVVAAILGVFILGDRLSSTNIAGVGVAALAIVLLSR